MVFHKPIILSLLIFAAGFMAVNQAIAQPPRGGAPAGGGRAPQGEGRSASGIERPVLGTAGAGSVPGQTSMAGSARERSPRVLQAGEFVGAIQTDEGFVGATMVEPEDVRSAIEGDLVVEARPQRPQGGSGAAKLTAAAGMYMPRLIFSPGSSLARLSAVSSESMRQTAARTLTQRFYEHPSIQGVQVVNEAGLITLRGVVRTDHERKLVELMSRMEPGVWDVRSEITVRKSE